ncbi:ATP-binding protein [Massilia sp. 9096]|uniref:hybrid sensor histidine kinase/response regulator n=1 Tax=Massilia sp. 9096 TaxID=1500894 RepID=UPI00056D95F7|nr:ATP-binding protein [Massilia sp. 9096]
MRTAAGTTLSLRHLLILLAAIGLLPLALLGVWSIDAAGQHRLREQERGLLDLARALASAVDAELDGTVATLSGMARSPALLRGDIPAFYAIAAQQSQVHPEWLGVMLADADGKMLFRTMAPYGAPPAPIADPASLQQALALRHPVAGRIARGGGGRPAVPVRVPVTDSAGRLYVLTAVIRPTRILRVVERQRAPSGSVIGVLDGSRSMVARSIDQDGTVTRAPSASLLALMRQGGLENTGETVTMEGRRVSTAYTTLSRYGWVVAVGAAPSSAPAGLALYGSGLGATLVACVALATWLAGRIARRIDQLAQGAAALGAGAPVLPAPSGIREIDAMGQALVAAARRRDRHEQERTRLLESLEQALRSQDDALEQARRAGRAKDEFLAVLGHELRNPLSPIVTALDLMDMRDEPSARRERGIMRRQVTHLKRLVDDLLDVSRIASGKLTIEPRPLNLADTVRHAVAALNSQAVTLEAPDAAWVTGDDSRLTQVLGNLLSNAARFGSTRTRVVLEVVEGEARLAVIDNGAGIALEHLPHIFEPFFQAPQALARATGGLGLGLAIVRRIVELHGGRISASSAGPGQGSRFEVVLPLVQPAHAPAPTAAPHDTRARRILLVDDNRDAAETTASLLASLGHSVRIAHDGAAALALAGDLAPDVAILDIGLPDMDGYALAAALRARTRMGVGVDADAAAQARGLRLVALTGYGQKEDVQRARAAGFDLHLTKPASVDDLQRALASAASTEPAP